MDLHTDVGRCMAFQNGTRGLPWCLEDVKKEIEAFRKVSGLPHPAVNDSSGNFILPQTLSRIWSLYADGIVQPGFDRDRQHQTIRIVDAACQTVRTGVNDPPFSERQQRQSRYDGGLEEDGTTERRLAPVQCVRRRPAHLAREQRRANHDHQQLRNEYKDVPLTGCQLCTAPHYLLPQSLGRECVLGEEGEIDVGDVLQLPGPPWVFDQAPGELQHFVLISGNLATSSDFEQDAIVFEKYFGLDVRFLHNHNHDHEYSGTCVKKTKTEDADITR